MQEQPQIYLISPGQIELPKFSDDLAGVLDSTEVACFRLALTIADADDIARAADVLRETCHARDVAIVIERHFRLVERLGLDGCHLPDGARTLREVRAALGPDAIIGAQCGASRHDGMSAAEAGADYISFGPLTATPLGDGTVAGIDLFQWWCEMIEIPVVAEGGLSAEHIAQFAPFTDFFAFGAEIWDDAAPQTALQTLLGC